MRKKMVQMNSILIFVGTYQLQTGIQWSPKSHETRDFLARNGIPYQWLAAESDKEVHYFIFFTHISQYFSIKEAPSTSNKAS
jgi:hypothetical protein